ncbi:MAG: 23S rRNA (guanosine(2251)-2'-O)-methyltransferase RlmB [Bacteroidia bacterium]|jgi:23S rRNA (guanosine2251-2'-O)-methyltransferase
MKNTSFVYGIRPVLEALESGKPIDKVWIQEGQVSGQLKEILSILHQRRIIWKQVPQEKLFKLGGGNHQGIVVAISAVEFAEISNVIAEAFEKGVDPFILVLDGVTDVRNFGAIARSAACAGVHAIVVPEKGGAAINSDAVKTSAGALLKIPVCRTNSLHHTLKSLKNSGLTIAGATEKGADSFYSCDFTGPLAIVMGNEETGLSADTWKMCEVKFKIPMSPFGVGSLNVSVAAGIAMFEAMRQRSIAQE